jgi:hypothetical protein
MYRRRRDFQVAIPQAVSTQKLLWIGTSLLALMILFLR